MALLLMLAVQIALVSPAGAAQLSTRPPSWLSPATHRDRRSVTPAHGPRTTGSRLPTSLRLGIAGHRSLPRTGLDLSVELAVGLVLLAAGATLVRSRSQRRS